MKVRKHFLFRGRVQGVGFRITVYQKAMQFGLTGWVKNLHDGSVEACIQGEEENIKRLVHEMQSIRYISIGDIQEENLEVLSEESSFDIRY